ncbi:hypothetical protein SBA4_1860011 [Candidatus Sulfopaludibacter sp. SbA4]|nr:hypothetical protein SBA4_1860011 [Candidatus Sulfopaludibacter sp. SbA4]
MSFHRLGHAAVHRLAALRDHYAIHYDRLVQGPGKSVTGLVVVGGQRLVREDRDERAGLQSQLGWKPVRRAGGGWTIVGTGGGLCLRWRLGRYLRWRLRRNLRRLAVLIAAIYRFRGILRLGGRHRQGGRRIAHAPPRAGGGLRLRRGRRLVLRQREAGCGNENKS